MRQLSSVHNPGLDSVLEKNIALTDIEITDETVNTLYILQNQCSNKKFPEFDN